MDVITLRYEICKPLAVYRFYCMALNQSQARCHDIATSEYMQVSCTNHLFSFCCRCGADPQKKNYDGHTAEHIIRLNNLPKCNETLYWLRKFKSGKCLYDALSVSSHINCIVERCMINFVYLTTCAFIRS